MPAVGRLWPSDDDDDDDGDRGGEVEFQVDQASVVGQVQVVADQLLALLRLAGSTGLEESFIETGVKCQRDVLCGRSQNDQAGHVK